MSGKNLRWLYDELPTLVSKGVLNSDAADRIQEHYGPAPETPATRVALVLCSVLGATLIGSGIILLLAHNWEGLSRPMRTVLSFSPLVIGQVLTVWTLFRKSDSTAWREGSAIFLVAGIGSSIALIGQTYHIPGNLTSFLFVWMWLGLPVIYLLLSTTVAVAYLIGTTCWAISAQSYGGHALWYGPLLIAILPYLRNALKHGSSRPGTTLLIWVLGLNLCVSLGVVLEKMMPGLWIPAYAAMFASMILAGRNWPLDARIQPFTVIGTTGAVIIAMIFTFDDLWQEVGYRHYRYGYNYYLAGAIQDYLIAVGLIALTVVLSLRRMRVGDRTFTKWVALPVFAIAFFGLQSLANSDTVASVAIITFNVYLFALGVHTMSVGIREGRLGTANGGMAILAILFIVRFFDSELGFVIRGIAFILIGMGFLLANVVMARRLRDTEGDVS